MKLISKALHGTLLIPSDNKYLQRGTIDGGTLPEIVITGFRPIQLRTYYPVISKYPFTGHSELYIPIDKQTFYNTPNLYINHKVIVNDELAPYIRVDKDSRSKNYNLITNNCADATLTYLNKIFGTSEKANFFTTPGDVKDFAEKKLNGRTFKRNGYYETLIPRNKNNYKMLSKKAIDNFSRDLHTNKYTIRLLQGGKTNLDNLVSSINKRSNADFVKRLKLQNRLYIKDWASDNIATHKLSWATDNNGAIVFPLVQRINGKLYDFTDPKNNRGKWDALDIAIERGDTLRMTPSEADLFTRNYKKYYPKFQIGGTISSPFGLAVYGLL